jgi:hypothetical protein
MSDKKIVAHKGDGEKETLAIDRFPDSCPICHNKLQPVFKFAYFNGKEIQIVFLCPNEECKDLFISYYERQQYSGYRASENYFYKGSLPWKVPKRDFSEEIKAISDMFIKIFNESREAEHDGLMEICGAGYRKALEFLVKDYLIKEKKLDAESIKGTYLGTCIDNHVDDANIKACAKRAAWLGNDQTHFYKKWEDKDLKDLKVLLELTVIWIQSECLTKKFMTEMPEDKPKKK